jgi:hypothetical protein
MSAPQLLPETQNHPLMRGAYALFTPPISEFFSTICDWIDGHVTGGYVYGPPRQGKSRAVQFWIAQLLTERYGSLLPFFRMNHKSHDRFSEGEFLAELLQTGHHRYALSGNRLTKLNRLVKLYATRARNAGGNQVILLIDEAQNMREQSYRTLCNLQNELEDLGFQLTVISVGTQELVYQHSAFAQGGDLHLIGRFMMREALFRGIRSEVELAYVLNAYDVGTEWPEGSGISYTRHFFPRAFEIGFRLVELAPTLWSIYVELAPPKLQSRLDVAMEHIAKPVETLFRRHGGDAIAIEFPRKVLTEAVESARYSAYMQAISLMPVGVRHVR